MHTPNSFPNPGNPVLSPSGHTSTGSSLPAPAGVVAAEGGTPSITLAQYLCQSAAVRVICVLPGWRSLRQAELRCAARYVIGWQA